MTSTFRFVLSIMILAASFAANAQTPKTADIHLGFTYPFSTNGIHAADYSNLISLHALVGVSHSERSLCAAGFGNYIKDTANGFVGAGFFNVIGNSASGVQAAGYFNYTKNNFRGFQGAGFVNVAGSVDGVQAAGFANIVFHNVNGVQLAGFMNFSRDVSFQASGYINVARDVKGGQVTGFVNVAHDLRGPQIAGYVNVAHDLRGPQIAGFVNVAHDVKGPQISGFVNVAHKVTGVQLSGFLNIADSSDCPIGLVNIIKAGEKAIGFNVDETGTSMLSFRSGGRVLYGIVGAGVNVRNNNGLFATQAGLGAHMYITKHFRINGEVVFTSLSGFFRKEYSSSSVRLIPAYKIGRLEVFGGPSFNYGVYSRHFGEGLASNTLWTDTYYRRTYEMHIGFVGGIQFHL